MSNPNHNATCSICGGKYEVCRSCADKLSLKPWKTVTDTIEHYKIYLAIHGYTVTKNKENARNELVKCDMSGLETFNPEIKSIIKEIMADPPKIKSVSKSKGIDTENASEKELIKENKFDE